MGPNNLSTMSARPTMTTREVAELTGKEHKHVLRDARAMLAELELPEGGYVQNWTDPQNSQRYPMLALPKDLTITLVAGYSAAMRHRIVQRWQELEDRNQPANDPVAALSDPAALRGLLLGYTERVLALEATVAEQAPKVQTLDKITASEGSRCITDAAKVLGIPPKQLFDFLELKQWIFRSTPGGPWKAYQHRIATCVLEHKTRVVEDREGKDKTVWQVLVTPRGLVRLAELQARETMQDLVKGKAA